MKMRGDGARAFGVALMVMAAACLAERGTEGGPAPGQLVVHPANPRWLVRYDPGGKHKPFFMCGPGDPEGFLYRGKLRPDGTRDGDQLKLIKKLKGTGANCIYLMAVRSHGGDGDKTENPFIDNDPKKGLNPKVLDQWDGWFAEMDKAGIVIFFFFYDDSARIWKTGDAVGMGEQRFIHDLVKRPSVSRPLARRSVRRTIAGIPSRCTSSAAWTSPSSPTIPTSTSSPSSATPARRSGCTPAW